MSFRNLFSRHAGSAWLRQMWLEKYLGEGPWELSIDDGEASFGEELTIPIQLLGSEAQGETQSWLWAWANDEIEPSEKSMQATKLLRTFGDEHGITEFTEATFPLEQADGHALAMTASALDGNNCYFRGPYEGGAVFFLLRNLPEERNDRVSAQLVIEVGTAVIKNFRVDNRVMLTGLLEDQGFSLRFDETQLTAARGDDLISAEFNDHDQAISLNGRMISRSPARWWQFWR